MNRKILWIVLIVLILLGTFAAASADQDGRRCWCNIDEYGCWITNVEGGKTYIMFWSEEARQYIMGTGSAPYKNVVAKPGSSDFLTIECGIPQPLVIATDPVVTPTPETTPTPDPTEDPTPDPTKEPTNTPVTPTATPVTPTATPVTPTATPEPRDCELEQIQCESECSRSADTCYERGLDDEFCDEIYQGCSSYCKESRQACENG